MQIHRHHSELLNRFEIPVAQKWPKTFVLASQIIIIHSKDSFCFHFTANTKLDFAIRKSQFDVCHSSCSSVIATYHIHRILT